MALEEMRLTAPSSLGAYGSRCSEQVLIWTKQSSLRIGITSLREHETILNSVDLLKFLSSGS